MSRKARSLLITSAIVLLGTLGVFFGSRGLRVEITNTTPEPLLDVELTHPGGVTRFARIDPNGSATIRVRDPIGFPSMIPMALQFSQQGEQSLPLVIHGRPRMVGWRTLNLGVVETRVHRSVVVLAGMVSHREFSFERLKQNSLDPLIGPRAFMSDRHVSVARTVIPRRNWLSEFSTAAAAVLAPRDGPLRGTFTLLAYLSYVSGQVVRPNHGYQPQPLPSAPLSLPIDVHKVHDEVNATLISLPLWP